MAGLEEISRRLYRQLDSIGYSHKMIGIRRNVYRCLGKLRSGREIKLIHSGSKGEGMSQLYESDFDILKFARNIICIEDPALEQRVPDRVTVFTILNTQPGYCMLELQRQGTIREDFITDCLVPFNEKVMLSSQVLGQEHFELIKPLSGETLKRTGPALTSTLKHGVMFDFVTTFSCVCRSILEDWANRPRPHDWPSSSLRKSVLQMTGNVVATGPDSSKTKHLEWRFCFNEIEMLILEKLNDTQLKLYKTLKIINSDIFKQQGLSLSSFIMKNIVFWIAETHPQSSFLPETIFHWVCEALLLLKMYVEGNKIPYYMIPDRNLLKEKVKETDRPKLIQVISNVLQLGPVLLYMCKTFRRHIDLKPSEFGVSKQKLEVFELCDLYRLYYLRLLVRQGKDPDRDVLYTVLSFWLVKILRSGWPTQIQKKISRCKKLAEACQLLLS